MQVAQKNKCGYARRFLWPEPRWGVVGKICEIRGWGKGLENIPAEVLIFDNFRQLFLDVSVVDAHGFLFQVRALE
jgi:hypothetical protein